MKKLLLSSILFGIGTTTFALSDYKNFQQFDNQVSFGINYQNGNFNNSQANGNPHGYSITALNLEVERLFDIGLWGLFDASVAQTYTQTITDNSNIPTQPVGSYPFLQTMNAKIGYNFPLLNSLSVTPYIQLGKNADLTSYTTFSGLNIIGSGNSGSNVTNDFYYTYGGGLRMEYIINKYVNVYLDQMVAQNSDQTGYGFNNYIISTSNTQWTTTLGGKINPWQKLQLGANLLYTNYNNYDQKSVTTLNSLGVAVPSTAFGFQMSAGFTFE
ncbi:MAG: hypothetical protein K2P99_02855 [Burkholderiales bacterium]|nr:hypothetical protein [Burkholderiales bacterium]